MNMNYNSLYQARETAWTAEPVLLLPLAISRSRITATPSVTGSAELRAATERAAQARMRFGGANRDGPDLQQRIRRPHRGCEAGPQPDFDRPLYVDRRLRALPHRHSVAAGAVSRPAGRYADDNAVRAADRIHARPAPRHRRRSSAQKPRLGAAESAGRPPQARRLRHSVDHAAYLE